MNREIKALLEDKINDVFIEMQQKMDIKSGDITPEMAFTLDEELNRLTEMIRDILCMQKGA